MTLVLLVALAAIAIGVVVTGGLAKQIGTVVGAGDSAVSVVEHRQVAGAC